MSDDTGNAKNTVLKRDYFFAASLFMYSLTNSTTFFSYSASDLLHP